MLMFMQPNNPSPAPPPINPQNMSGGNSQYDFITNPGSPKPSKFNFKIPGGSKKTQRIIFISGVIVFLIIGFMIFSTIAGSGNKAQKEQLKQVVYKQKELIRISEIGFKKARTNEAKNLAITTQLSLTSEQSELQGALKILGVKSDAKSVGGADKKKDEKLTAAEQSNSFDEVFLEMLKADLIDYAKATQEAYKNNTSKKTKAALESQFNNAATLAGLNKQN